MLLLTDAARALLLSGRARAAAGFIYETPLGDNHGHGTHTSGTAIGATLGRTRCNR